MTHRVRVARVGLAMVLAGCTSPHPVSLAGARRSPPSPPTPTTVSPGKAPAPPPTTAPTTGGGPAAVAARFTIAYFTATPGDTPGAQRQRCRPYDTDTLDQLLAAPSWNGAGNDPPPDLTVTATIDAVNPVDTAAQGDTDRGVGYELTVTVTASPAGQPSRRDQRGVQLWLSADPAGVWRVAQVSVT